MAECVHCHKHVQRIGRTTGRLRYCDPCRRAVNFARSQAVGAVAKAVTAGKLHDLRIGHIACKDCGKTATCYDHRNYNKPLKVDPVCCSCNLKRGPAIMKLAQREEQRT